jgi:hypothetical protein
MVVLFSCKKEINLKSEDTQSEAYYEAMVRQKVEALPEITPALRDAKNPGFASFKDAYNFLNSLKIVGRPGTINSKVNIDKSNAANARMLEWPGEENIWYNSTTCFAGAHISAWYPTYIWATFSVTPFVRYGTRTLPSNGQKEYYTGRLETMNIDNISYALDGVGTITPQGSPIIDKTSASQLLQYSFMVLGNPFSAAIQHEIYANADIPLPAYDYPPMIQISYSASGSFL